MQIFGLGRSWGVLHYQLAQVEGVIWMMWMLIFGLGRSWGVLHYQLAQVEGVIWMLILGLGLCFSCSVSAMSGMK